MVHQVVGYNPILEYSEIVYLEDKRNNMDNDQEAGVPIGKFNINYLNSKKNLVPAIPDAEYEKILAKFLNDRNDKEVFFFRNKKRFYLMNDLIGHALRTRFKSILNVGCGPFAFENYFDLPNDVQIDSFDNDIKLDPLYKYMRDQGYFSNCKFTTNSIEEYSTEKQYDLVLMNDLFFFKFIDFFECIDSYMNFVKPGGFLYFDLLDARIGWLWSWIKNDDRYRRYDLSDVQTRIEKMDFKIVRIAPSLGINSGLNYTARSMLYRGSGLANNFIFVCQKSSTA